MVFFLSATGASIRFAFDRLKAVNELEKLEETRTIAELKSLKDQINPHFLFNALNTIYYKIDRLNSEARVILQKFSEMLRYQLYECDKEFTNLQKELQFLKSYIELQKARLGNNYEISYKGFDADDKFSIAPFLLMPVIENCFKHVSDYNDKPNRIIIEVTTENNHLLLYTFNTVQLTGNNQQGGIGMDNIKRRLNFLYQNKYVFETKSTAQFYEVNLKLALQ